MNTPQSISKHPVWSVYDEYRTARLNVRYYEKQLQRLKRNNFYIESIFAISTSSVVAGLWFWESVAGGYAWKIIVTIAAFLAVLRPLWKIPDKIEKNSEILYSYRMLDHEFHKIKIKIEQYKEYGKQLRDEFMTLVDMKGNIARREPNQSIDQKLRRECRQQVNNELPSNAFYIPED